MTCPRCGGFTEPGTVGELFGSPTQIVAVERLPAVVCRQCGECLYTPAVAEWLCRLVAATRASQVSPSRLQLTVFDAGG